MSKAQKTYFNDGRFIVTSSDVRTKRLYYPIDGTTGRVRNDIQFAALGLAVLIGTGLSVYWPLWFPHEKLIMGAVIALALLTAVTFSTFQIDARGFPPRILIGRRRTVRKVFEAITEARAENTSVFTGGGEVE
ncbi:MAG: hypothetical protein AAGJ51_09070 [Pseudomonadota bacterium]